MMTSRSDRGFERIRAIAAGLAAGGDAQLPELCLKEAVAAVEGNGGTLALARPDGTLEVVAAIGYPREVVARFATMRLADELPLTQAARLGRTVHVTTAKERADRYPDLPERGATNVRASVSLPLRYGSRVLGAFGVSFDVDRTVGPDELEILETLAAQAAVVLELGRLTSLGRQASALFDSGLVGIAAGDEGTVREANDRFLQMLGLGRGDLEGGLSLADITPPEHLERDRRDAEWFRESTGHNVVAREYLRRDGSRVPVLVGATVLERDPYGWIAVVVDLTEQKRVEAALEASRRAEAEARFRTAFASIVDAFAILSPVRDGNGSIVDFRYRYSSVELHPLTGVPKEQVIGALLLDHFPEVERSYLLRDYRSVIETGVDIHHPAIRWVSPDGKRRAIDVHAARLGSDLLLAWSDVSDAVDQADELVRRQRHLEEAQRRLEEERRAVEVLQEAVLPTELPELDWVDVDARYISASENRRVGGDWYDVLPLPDGSLFLAIGDVMGHGVRASGIAVEARNALRSLVFEGHDPARALTLLSEYFRHRSEDHFGTAAVGILRPDGALELSLGGHMPPVLSSPGSGAELVGSPGMLLGVEPVHPRRVERFCLQPGSTLLLYTDGLVERRDEAIQDGLDRVRHAVGNAGAAETCDAVLAKCLADGAVDDVCVLAVHFRVPAVKDC